MMQRSRISVVLVAILLLMPSPGFAGTWVPYMYDNSNAPSPVGDADEMSSDAGCTFTTAAVKAGVIKILGIGWPGFSEDGTATAYADCTVGMRVMKPCTKCFSYAWSANCEIGKGSEIKATATAWGINADAWGSSQAAYIVYGDVALKGKDAIAVDDQASGVKIDIGWPGSLKLSPEQKKRTNNTDQIPFAGNTANRAQGTEVQVCYAGFSKVKGHAETDFWSFNGSHALCKASSNVVAFITLKGFRAFGKVIIQAETDVPVAMITFSAGVTAYQQDQGLPIGPYEHMEATGPLPGQELHEPPHTPAGRIKDDFELPDSWSE